MRKLTKNIFLSILIVSILFCNLMPINSYAEINNKIEITLDTKEVYLNEATKVSISFKEYLNNSKITLVQKCADEQLLTELYYNEDTKSYEGIINYNIELEAINIWSLDKIIVGDKIITKDQLKDMGLDLGNYEVKQKYYTHDIDGIKYQPNARSVDQNLKDKYSKYTVLLDPGHGGKPGSGYNWGGTTIVNDTLWEKDYNLDTTLYAAKQLSDLGVNVVLTRNKDVYVALQDRTNLINKIKPDFAVSIHYNALTSKSNGTSAYYRYADRNGGLTKTLAGNIVDSIIDEFGFYREGILYRTYVDSATKKTLDYYHMIRESKFPTVLVECCYLSNVKDQAKVNTKAKREIMGREIAEGIIKTLDQMNGNGSSEEDKDEDKDDDKVEDEYKENVSKPETTVKTATATGNVNVRKGPSTNYTSLGVLKVGQKVEILGTDSATGWYKIKYNNGYGYVSNKYLKIDSSNQQSPTLSKPTVKVSSNSYNSNKLSWNKVTGSSGYEVLRATSKTGTYKSVKTITSGSTVSYTDKSLATGTTYYYKVRAYRTVDKKKVYSSYSSVVSAKPVLKTPSVKLTSGSKKATIKWEKISGASGYEVYRATSKSGKYSKIKTITKNSTVSYVNSSLTKNKTYYYKVRAYRTVNGKKIYSSYSVAKSVKVK
ncbi:MAG: N-acetylmuramoyl-L-alanine amidase [Terrisporobacter sp.]|uniref:N-acetylmuramoyl-L-alanine amidase n=1 Tax=Terrisporobacter sp. TaxID=1965305 RepID=UPI002A918AE9|nr:N-acetylmuramoyl-L-alanine amidase [Terrisporobacter sp.]MDY6152961.1 N-acetylmuramoyl-L-alanine amidase [Terrisporobacter sp.]